MNKQDKIGNMRYKTRKAIRRVGAAVLLGSVLVGQACSPKAKTAAERQAEKRQQDSVALVEQERSWVYYDSVKQTLLPQADSLMREFAYEKNEKYEDNGRYTHKLLRTGRNTARNYLQATVTDNGKIEVKCFYYGAKAIGMEEVVLTAVQGEAGAENVADRFRGSTHAFEAEGWHETMTLTGEDAVRFLHFADVYGAERVRVAYEGTKSREVFYLSQNDKKALMTTYQFGVVVQDIQKLDTQLKMTQLQIEKYQKRLQKQTENK